MMMIRSNALIAFILGVCVGFSFFVLLEKSKDTNQKIKAWRTEVHQEKHCITVDNSSSNNNNESSVVETRATKSPTKSPTKAPTNPPTNPPITPAITTVTTGSEWTPLVQEEMIPESLHTLYQPDNLHFNVTRSMLRRSRPIVGNVERFHRFLRKLQAGQCTTVVVMGGSVTMGHNAGGPRNAYPLRFIDWLNARYPCKDGMHVYNVTHGTLSIQAIMTSWQQLDSFPSIDLVLIEYHVNDNFISGIPHALEDKGSIATVKDYICNWYNEVILRRLLLLRVPDPVAIIVFDADYIGRNWANRPYYNPETARRALYNGVLEPAKVFLSSMYEVPLVSAVSWMLPMAGKWGRDMQFDRVNNTFNTASWHVDACCHPPPKGHVLLSLILAYNLVEEEKSMMLGEVLSEGEGDYTAKNPPILRTPIYLSPEEDDVWVQNSDNADQTLLDFQDSQGEDNWKKYLVENQGWSWYADNREKDKFGLITVNYTEGVPHAAFNVVGGRHKVIEVGYLVSYANIGTALVWVNDSPAGPTKCDAASIGTKVFELNGRWTSPASVPKFGIFRDAIQQDESKTLHICLAPRIEDMVNKNEANKFKLQSIRLF